MPSHSAAGGRKMARFRVASVPYVNAYPLVRDLLRDPDSEVVVQFALPSALPELLDSGEVDAILVSSIDALRSARRRVALTACIGSMGPVESVRLFSKVPFKRIESLALDGASLTSNALCQILLEDRYGVRPALETMASDQAAMLDKCDACVLIGDIGMMAWTEGLHVLDLGEAWTKLTHLPFMWAAWVGNDGLTPELASYLTAPTLFSEPYPRTFLREFRAMEAMPACASLGAAPEDEEERELVYSEVAEQWGWPLEVARRYLHDVMHYDLSVTMVEGFREFQRRLLVHGFADCSHFPELVEPAFDQVLS